jgi:hypothetical protein
MEECWIDFDDFLQEAISEGMRLPFHVTVLARNGGMIFCRFYYGAQDYVLDSEVLATHEPNGQLFEGPITLLLVDSQGAAKLGSLDELTAN